MINTVNDKIKSLEKKIANLKAGIQGSFVPNNLYALIGNQVIFGCLITEGYASDDFVLALEEDSANLNPDKKIPPQRTEHYPNIANVFGRSFLMTDVNTSILDNEDLIIDDPPSTENTARHDIVYIYVNNIGPGIGILTGTASSACYDNFIANGLTEDEYQATYDSAALPEGCVPIARVYVQYGDTGITNNRIADLRQFSSRLLNDRMIDGRRFFIQETEPSDDISSEGDIWIDIS